MQLPLGTDYFVVLQENARLSSTWNLMEVRFDDLLWTLYKTVCVLDSHRILKNKKKTWDILDKIKKKTKN